MNKVIEEILSASKITIFSHIKTDGDAVGSSLALFEFCKNHGKEVCVAIDSEMPNHLLFMSNIGNINNNVFFKGDLAIVVDCIDADRVGKNKFKFKNYKKIINIDHHAGNAMFGALNYVKEAYSSACEVVYDLFDENGIELSPVMAEDLFTGLLTDTGNLFYNSATPATFAKAGKLLEISQKNLEYFTRNLFSDVSMNIFELKKMVYNTIEFYDNKRIALIKISNADLAKCGVNMIDTKSVLEIATSIKEVMVVIEITEGEPETCYVSLRSKGDIDCSVFAEKFGGGGHMHASGCRIYDTLENASKKVLEVVKI